jgi:DNA polymerase-4
MVTKFTAGRIDIPHNPEPPEVMHIDLNSAFAMAEQQARPHLRNRAVGISNRLYRPGTRIETPFSICITASYEAKRQGIKIGTKWQEAKIIDPDFTMLESNPARYITAHRKMKAIFEDYSPNAFMKSIDEGIIDLRGHRRLLKGRSLMDIGAEIKQRVREEVGDYMTVNVGIGQNYWLAKVAAGLNKPDGLDMITRENIREVFSRMELVDLPYIKHRNAVRLRLAGITTPVEFLEAPYWVLFRQVFNSVMGHHWYLKLRGYETDPVEFEMRQAGRSYVLEHRTSDPDEILALLHKSALKISRKLYITGKAARGITLRLRYVTRHDEPGRPSWRGKRMWATAVRREDELYARVKQLFEESPPGETVMQFEMDSYGLVPAPVEQPTLFEDKFTKRARVQTALDELADRFGEMTVVPADVAMSKNPMKDKVPFYSTRFFGITGM